MHRTSKPGPRGRRRRSRAHYLGSTCGCARQWPGATLLLSKWLRKNCWCHRDHRVSTGSGLLGLRDQVAVHLFFLQVVMCFFMATCATGKSLDNRSVHLSKKQMFGWERAFGPNCTITMRCRIRGNTELALITHLAFELERRWTELFRPISVQLRAE